MNGIFDPTVSLGSLINAMALLIGFVVAFTRIGGRIDLLTLRMVAVEQALTAQRDVDKRLIRIEEQLVVAQRDLADLRRGEGWVRPKRTTIDGEYP